MGFPAKDNLQRILIPVFWKNDVCDAKLYLYFLSRFRCLIIDTGTVDDAILVSTINKTDTSQAATKKDLHDLRGDVKKIEKSLRTEILRVEEKVEVIDEKVEKLDGRAGKLDGKMETLQEGQEKMASALTKLQNTLDGFVGTVDDLRTDNQVGTHHVRELEIRVTKLESSPHSTSK